MCDKTESICKYSSQSNNQFQLALRIKFSHHFVKHSAQENKKLNKSTTRSFQIILFRTSSHVAEWSRNEMNKTMALELIDENVAEKDSETSGN